jgi:hypothetical protein
MMEMVILVAVDFSFMYPTNYKTGKTAKVDHDGPLTPSFRSQLAQSIKIDTLLKANMNDALRVIWKKLTTQPNRSHLSFRSSSGSISTTKPKKASDIPLPTGPRMNALAISSSSSVGRLQLGTEGALGSIMATASGRPMCLNIWSSLGVGVRV